MNAVIEPTDAPDNRALTAAPPATDQDGFINMLERLVRDPTVDPARLLVALDVKDRVDAKRAELWFNQDYMEAKKEMPRIKKDGTVAYQIKGKPEGEMKEAFRFGKIETIETDIEPIETKYGFARIFTSSPRIGEGGGITATVTLIHKGGHSIKSDFSAGLDTSGGKSNLQGMHSSYTLAKRVATFAVWNLVYEGQDDGGNSDKNRYVSDELKAQIIDLIRETGTDTKRLLAAYEVRSVDEILHRNAPGVINALNSKLLKLKAAK
jgi:hypothetical protein